MPNTVFCPATSTPTAPITQYSPKCSPSMYTTRMSWSSSRRANSSASACSAAAIVCWLTVDFRNAHAVGHLRNHLLVAARGNSIHQKLEHAPLQPHLIAQRHIGRNRHLLIRSRSTSPQAWLADRQLAVAQVDLPWLLPVPHQGPIPPPFALLPGTGHLFGRHLQNRVDGDSADRVHQLIDGHTRLLDQLHHGQELLPVFHQEGGELLLTGCIASTQGVIISCHGGFSFHKRFRHPDSCRTGDKTAVELSTTYRTPSSVSAVMKCQRTERDLISTSHHGPFVGSNYQA